jgi:subtilase family serine protease
VRPRVVEAVDDARRITLSGNVHPLARVEFDRGAVAESQPMNRILLLLKRSNEQEAALQDALAKQQDKSSPSFHQWLTPEQFGAQFGPADADIQAVTDWLTRQGFTVGKIYSGKTVIEFSGTAGQVQRAFGAAIHNYQVNGKVYSANASDPQIPAALVPVVSGVVSLHNFPRDFYARRFGTLRHGGGKSVVEPLTTFPNPFGPGNFYGLGPGDFAKIYGVPATCGNPAVACTGSGQTIAIVGETNLVVADVQQFRSVFGLPPMFDATSIVYNGEDPGITSTNEEGEADLDTQWSGGVAPGATIKYVLSASTPASQGVDLSALYIVEHNLAAVMSESYGNCESGLGSAGNSFYNNLWQQASAQGITVAVSTGDSGSAGCDDPHTEGLATNAAGVNGLASTPYNVAVGGTDFDEYNNWAAFWNTTNDAASGASAKGYIPEIPWNQSCAQLGANGCNINTTPVPLQNIVAGGGGPSATYKNKPIWQVGTAGMPNDGNRDLPDISLLASPGFNGSGYLYCQGDVSSPCLDSSGFNGYITFGVIGGTSVSAPAFAGIMALINQSQATAQNPAPRQGNANYVLYALAHKPSASCTSSVPVAAGCVFNDISKGSSALPTGGTGIGTISVPCKGGVLGCSAALSTQIGVLDDPNKPGTMAWNAGAGYDMATGLGSLNVGNLATDWGSVATVPTTTTLTLSPPAGTTHGSGENVPVSVTVSPKNGTATGTVSLIAQLADGTNFGVGEFTLGTNGSITGTTTNLPGGTNYPVYAHYSGDGVNAPSDSTPVTVSVAPETSQTFIVIPTFDSTGNLLNGNTTSLTYGSSYIIRMYVTNSGGAPSTSGTPTGTCTQASKVACPSRTVTLTANGQGVDRVNGIYHLNDIGYTRDLSPALSGGTYNLVAAYSGDTSYQASNTSETFTVNVAPTTLTTPFSGNYPFTVGTPTTIGSDVNVNFNGGAAPTGTITYYDGTTQLAGTVNYVPIVGTSGSPAVLRSVITTTFTTGGTHTITAKYSGDMNYAAATSSALNEPAVYPTNLVLTLSTTNINFGQNLTATAQVTTSVNSPPMSGQIRFSGYPQPSLVTGTLGTDTNGNQVLSATTSTTLLSSDDIQAIYEGDANFQSSVAMTWVNVFTPDFSLPSSPAITVTAGQTGMTTINVTPLSNVPSPVTMSVVGTAPGGMNLTFNPTIVNLNGSPVPVTLTLTTTGPSPVAASAVKANLQRAGLVGNPKQWWSVSLTSALLLMYFVGFPRRRRGYRVAFFTGGLCILTFVLGCGGGGGGAGGGGGGGGGSGGGGGGGGTGPVPTSISITTSNAKVPASGGSFTLTATVTSTKQVTGTVLFSGAQSAFPYPNGVPLVNGVASYTVNVGPGAQQFPVGTYPITAQYSGDANNLASQTATGVNEVFTGTMLVTIIGQTGTISHPSNVVVTLQ